MQAVTPLAWFQQRNHEKQQPDPMYWKAYLKHLHVRVWSASLRALSTAAWSVVDGCEKSGRPAACFVAEGRDTHMMFII